MDERRVPGLLGVSETVYDLLLLACPAEYRCEYGVPMAQAFRDLAREAYLRHGAWGVAALWLRILPDAFRTAFAEHVVALRERGALADVELAAAGGQGIFLSGGGSPMRRKMVVGLVVAAIAGIVASSLLFQYRPAVAAAPGVVLHVPTQPGWLDGLVKAQQDWADQVPSTYTLVGWSADGVLCYQETVTATQARRTWAYRPGKGAHPQLVAATAELVPTAVSPREALLERVRAGLAAERRALHTASAHPRGWPGLARRALGGGGGEAHLWTRGCDRGGDGAVGAGCSLLWPRARGQGHG